MSENPFDELNDARLKKEAEDQEYSQARQPFNAMVVETFQQLIKACGWEQISALDKDQWEMSLTPTTTYRTYNFHLILRRKAVFGEEFFDLLVRTNYNDGRSTLERMVRNGIDPDKWFRSSASKEGLVQMLTDAVKHINLL